MTEAELRAIEKRANTVAYGGGVALGAVLRLDNLALLAEVRRLRAELIGKGAKLK